MKKLITAGAVLSLIGTPAFAQSQEAAAPLTPSEQIEQATAITKQWVEVQSTIAKEGNQWKVDKHLIQQRIDLFSAEMESLQQEIKELEDKAATGQGKRASYTNQINELQNAQNVVLGVLPRYEADLLELSKFFPTPLANSTETLMAPLRNKGKSNLGVGQRLALIVGVLNEVDKFNKDITTTKEERSIDGKNREVYVMYLGLGQAFYADEQGTIAGTGTPDPAKGGWKWESHDDQAEQIARAIAVAQGKIKPAEFVNLPMQVTTVKALSK